MTKNDTIPSRTSPSSTSPSSTSPSLTGPRRRLYLATLLGLMGLLFLVPFADAEERVLGAPSYDHLSETTYRKVSWDDFRGNGKQPPGWNRWQNGSYAHIATAIKLGHFEIDRRKEGADWVARPVGIRPYAVMAKDFSAGLPGSRDDFTLAHEQLHFDIAEMMARRIATRLDKAEGRGSSERAAEAALQQEIEDLLTTGKAELDEIQARYDGDTGRSVQKRKQKRWAKDVAEMFAEATRELEAVLAARKGRA